jgi:hypothetical protein
VLPPREGLVDVFYRIGTGPYLRFDSDSFGRWRPRWQREPSEESLFAQELVFGERVPVSESPLQLDSLAHLLARGEGYVADGAEWGYAHPLHALGVVVFVQGLILVASLGRAVRQSIVIAAKYHPRRALGVPVDGCRQRIGHSGFVRGLTNLLTNGAASLHIDLGLFAAWPRHSVRRKGSRRHGVCGGVHRSAVACAFASVRSLCRCLVRDRGVSCWCGAVCRYADDH